MMENVIEQNQTNRAKDEDGLKEGEQVARQDAQREVETEKTIQPKSGDLHNQAMGFWLLGR